MNTAGLPTCVNEWIKANAEEYDGLALDKGAEYNGITGKDQIWDECWRWAQQRTANDRFIFIVYIENIKYNAAI